MRVLVAGATGVIGRQLVPLLTSLGHGVTAVSRHVHALSDPGVQVVNVDALDREEFAQVVRAARPDAVIHLLTAIPPVLHPRRIEAECALTNRLRMAATETLVAAAREVGCARIITQSVAFAYQPGDRTPADEDARLFTNVARQWRTSLAAIERLEALTTGAGGRVLRFGHLYGPGTAYAKDGATVAQVKAHKFPIAGRGDAVFSFTHTYDAATAIAAALSRPMSGVLNVIDDDPARIADWLPELATLLGAKPPGRVPVPLLRLVGGAWAVTFLTQLRGADNARARKELDWRPRYPSWRDGFRAELGPT